MSSGMFRTGLRAPHVVLAGAKVPAGTVLVTPDLNCIVLQLTPLTGMVRAFILPLINRRLMHPKFPPRTIHTLAVSF